MKRSELKNFLKNVPLVSNPFRESGCFPLLSLCGTIRCHVNMVIGHVMYHIKEGSGVQFFPRPHFPLVLINQPAG